MQSGLFKLEDDKVLHQWIKDGKKTEAIQLEKEIVNNSEIHPQNHQICLGNKASHYNLIISLNKTPLINISFCAAFVLSPVPPS